MKRVQELNSGIDKLLEDLVKLPVPDIDIAKRAIDHTYFDGYSLKEPLIRNAEGITMRTETLWLEGEHFTNRTEIKFDPKFRFDVVTNNTPFSLRNIMRRGKKRPLACIDAGFFFLSDEKDGPSPNNVNYNLNIQDSQVICLPISDRPAILIIGGMLEAKLLNAVGKLKIGSNEISWVGSRSDLPSQNHAVLYNSTNCTIKHVANPETGTKRKVDDTKNKTPKNQNIADIIVSYNYGSKTLEVIGIKIGGESDFFEGSFIIQVDASIAKNIKIGEPVIASEIDGINLEKTKIDSGVTIGPSIFDDIDSSVFRSMGTDVSHCGDKPLFVRGARRAARAILSKNNDGSICFTIFDGAPKSNLYQGIRIEEIPTFFDSSKTEWAFHLDGGQSARAIVNVGNGTLIPYGNYHYSRWPKREGGLFLNTALNGRRVPSAIAVYSE